MELTLAVECLEFETNELATNCFDFILLNLLAIITGKQGKLRHENNFNDLHFVLRVVFLCEY